MGIDNVRPCLSVCFIVLTFRNPPADLASLFESLLEGAKKAGVSAQCVLVSNDDAFDSQLLPGVDVCVGHGNVGFASGIRIGVQMSTSDYVVIANPDLTVTPLNVQLFTEALIGQSGVMVPIIRDGSGEVAYESYEDWVFTVGRQFSERVCRRFLLQDDRSRLPRWVKICGAFVGMPTKLAKAYGPFDEAFFMYGEDRDLTSRFRRDGIPVQLLRVASVTHIGGGSGGGMQRELAIFKSDSSLRIAYRRYGTFGVWLKSIDLWFEAKRRKGNQQKILMEARRLVISRWRAKGGEAPRLDFASLAQDG